MSYGGNVCFVEVMPIQGGAFDQAKMEQREEYNWCHTTAPLKEGCRSFRLL